MEALYPGFTRPVLFSYRFYNQDLTTGSCSLRSAATATTSTRPSGRAAGSEWTGGSAAGIRKRPLRGSGLSKVSSLFKHDAAQNILAQALDLLVLVVDGGVVGAGAVCGQHNASALVTCGTVAAQVRMLSAAVTTCARRHRYPAGRLPAR